MTNALISTVIAAAATFLAAGLVIQFALGSSKAAQEELRGGVNIDEPEAMYQLIMYDSLIAYQCDDSAGGNLDATGDNDWASWQTYKEAAADQAGDFTFQDLNESFRGDKLECYGTETSIGGKSAWDAVNPASREWRNDQEGEHSKIRWSVNTTDHGVHLKPCMFVDQPQGLGWPGSHNPDNGWHGITDMVYYITDNTEVNSHDYTVHTNDLISGDPDCKTRTINGASGNDLGGNFLTVNVICADSSSSECSGSTYTNTHWSRDNERYPDSDGTYPNRIRGPDQWSNRDGYASGKTDMKVRGYKLCPGARGFIQTNTGWTYSGDDDTITDGGWDVKDYMKNNGGTPYTASPPHYPGMSNKEKYSDKNDDEDNSVHPFIVIEEVGDTDNCGTP